MKQRAAIEAILSSRDQIIGLQGGAGTGKTTALSVLREAAEKEGYQVRGFAPSTRAAQQLGESGIETETIQKFLRRRKQPATVSRLFVLDESSLASTKHIQFCFARISYRYFGFSINAISLASALRNYVRTPISKVIFARLMRRAF